VNLAPTQALRKLLRIPRHIAALTPEKIENVALPKLKGVFADSAFTGLADKEGLRWAQFDYSAMLIECVRDSHGRWIARPEIRTVERTTETEIRADDSDLARAARPGTAVHAWRSLGLIDPDGKPTQRGIIFSFFQHGEGLAIAAALEDEHYPLDELVPHLANLRSDCRFDMPEACGSERLVSVCRATYGFVNHHGYLDAGLPLGYGEGTAELLGICGDKPASTRGLEVEAAEGDLSRAYIEWLSLLRHIKHAPDHEWPRWREFKKLSAQVLERHLGISGNTLHPKLPPLTPKQKHDRPRLWIR
jgi:hypothetical protein